MRRPTVLSLPPELVFPGTSQGSNKQEGSKAGTAHLKLSLLHLPLSSLHFKSGPLVLQEVEDSRNGILQAAGPSAPLPAGSRRAHAVVRLAGGVRFKIFEVVHSVDPHSDGSADRGAIDCRKLLGRKQWKGGRRRRRRRWRHKAVSTTVTDVETSVGSAVVAVFDEKMSGNDFGRFSSKSFRVWRNCFELKPYDYTQ